MSFSDNSSLFLLFLLFGPIPAFNLLRLLHCEIISCMMYHRGKASCSVHLLLIGGVSANSCWRRFLVRHQSIKLMIRRCQTLHRTLSVSVSPCVCVCVCWVLGKIDSVLLEINSFLNIINLLCWCYCLVGNQSDHNLSKYKLIVPHRIKYDKFSYNPWSLH